MLKLFLTPDTSRRLSDEGLRQVLSLIPDNERVLCKNYRNLFFLAQTKKCFEEILKRITSPPNVSTALLDLISLGLICCSRKKKHLHVPYFSIETKYELLKPDMQLSLYASLDETTTEDNAKSTWYAADGSVLPLIANHLIEDEIYTEIQVSTFEKYQVVFTNNQVAQRVPTDFMGDPMHVKITHMLRIDLNNQTFRYPLPNEYAVRTSRHFGMSMCENPQEDVMSVRLCDDSARFGVSTDYCTLTNFEWVFIYQTLDNKGLIINLLTNQVTEIHSGLGDLIDPLVLSSYGAVYQEVIKIGPITRRCYGNVMNHTDLIDLPVTPVYDSREAVIFPVAISATLIVRNNGVCDTLDFISRKTLRIIRRIHFVRFDAKIDAVEYKDGGHLLVRKYGQNSDKMYYDLNDATKTQLVLLCSVMNANIISKISKYLFL